VIYIRNQSNATVIQVQGNIRTDRSEEFISSHAELHHTHKPLWNYWMCNCCVVPVTTDVQVLGMSTDTAGASELFRRVRKC